MAWEYLKTTEFDYRYKLAADFLGDCSDKIILDINCGEPHFKNYIKHKEYHASDIVFPEDTANCIFYRKDDTEIDMPCDILCCFGYGGGEYTGEPMESKTAGQTILRLSKHKPEYIIIEMAQKWEEDFKAETWFKDNLKKYKPVYGEKYSKTDPEHYHDFRQIIIFKHYAIQ